MRRALPALLALPLFILAWTSIRPPGSQAQTAAGGLPGARPVIEAGDYPSIQAAINALPPEGGMVRIPPGRFEIDRPLVINREDVTVEGSGSATHIKNANADGQPAIVVQPTTIKADPKARIWRVRLSNFRVTGNPGSGHGIHASGVNEIFIDGVTVSEHGGDGIRLDDCYEDPRIVNSLISYNRKTGLDIIRCHDIVVAANQFEENQDALRCIDSFNLCMTGNNVDDHLGDGVVIENTYGSVVSGNMIEECKGTAIILDRDCYGITLSANVIAHEETAGIDLRDAHGCAVSANTFTLVKKDALLIGPASGRIAVTGNCFADSFIGESQVKRKANDRAASGLTLKGTSDVAVSGNLFAGVGPKGVAVEGEPSHRVLFSDNVLTDTRAESEKLLDSVTVNNLQSRP